MQQFNRDTPEYDYLRMLAARHALGLMSPCDLSQVGDDLLSRSVVSEAVLSLYWERSPDRQVLERAFLLVLAELGVSVPSPELSVSDLTRWHMGRITSGVTQGECDVANELQTWWNHVQHAVHVHCCGTTLGERWGLEQLAGMASLGPFDYWECCRQQDVPYSMHLQDFQAQVHCAAERWLALHPDRSRDGP